MSGRDLTPASALPAVQSERFAVPKQIASAGDAATERFFELFIATTRNENTRKTYLRAAKRFFAWADQAGLTRLDDLRPLHLATYIEALGQSHERASVKLHLAALRRLFDWMVTGGYLAINPATSVKGPTLQVRRGKTNVLTAGEVRQLLDSIPLIRTETMSGLTAPDAVGLRDRALIATMTFTFSRVGGALALVDENVERRNHRLWLHLLEKGGVLEKAVAMAAHASTRTTQLYDRRDDQPTLDEFEKIRI